MNERREGRSRAGRLWLITLAGLLGLLLFIGFYDRAFPSAAIDLQLSQAEINQRATRYMEDRGFDLDGYRSATVFSGGGRASYYLQQTLGVPETNDLIRETDLTLWQWNIRWFRPLEKEAYTISLAPDGQVVGFSHTLREDDPGASLPPEEAQALAQDYLAQDRGWDLDCWEVVSASSEDQPGGRTDHYFSWKRTDWDVGESELRLSVTVQGDEVGYYSFWLKIPEAFQRNFEETEQLAGFVDGLSTSGADVLIIVALILAAWRAGWRLPALRAAPILPAAAAAIVVALNNLNWLPLAKAWYDTTQRYSLFWFNEVSWIFVVAAFSGIEIFILWYLAHWMSQRIWPRQDRILPRRGDRWQRMARSGWRGLMIGMMWGGYAVAFYLLATQVFGGWTPMGPDYSNSYATPLPFLGSLQSGLLPALREELTYRLLGIAAVLWLLRTFTRLPERLNRFLALLVPGVLWAFAHSTYIRDPFYLRGIELSVIAVVAGWIFLRFDLTTTIVAHFVYNAGLGALPLLRSGEPYFVVSGLIVVAFMLVPLVPYAVRTARRRWGAVPGEEAYPHIRPARPADEEQLAALDLPGSDWKALLIDPAAEVLCLAAGGEVVGVAAGRMVTENEGTVAAVYVAPRWRRRYWGSELLHRLQGQLRHRGATSVQASVAVEDRIGMSFLSSQGWDRIRVIFTWPPQPPALPNLWDLGHRLLDLWDRDQPPADEEG